MGKMTLWRHAGRTGEMGYLAQHPLFDQIPELAADIREPAYCALGAGKVQSVNAWLGPPGTVRSHVPYALPAATAGFVEQDLTTRHFLAKFGQMCSRLCLPWT